ncbi:MAG: hypothetical protein O2954_05755 [bacterium]|nr:hypothetical protein [bacterium]
MVSEKEKERWVRHLLPLPHEIEFEGRVECRPEEIGIRVCEDSGAIASFAVEALRRLFEDRTGVAPKGNGFEIVVGVADEAGMLDGIAVDVERLRSLPNREQAYVIFLDGENRLVLSGLNERGISYAVRTLSQLLEATLSAEQVVIPLVRVTDWPDLDERGMWNFPEPAAWIPWMASMKMNYGKMASTELEAVERGKPNRARIDRALMEEARLHGFNYLPYVLHLNFLHAHGLFRTYPELAGKGDGALTGRYFAHKQGNQHRAPCASNPLLAEILAEWMADIASQGATEVSCWLSERPGQCGCTACTAVGQFVLESRAFVKAWEKVKIDYPDVRIRMFLSTVTAEKDYRVLAELPEGVKVERACATAMERVLHLPRDLSANPLFDHHTAQGRWIATYDVPVGANGRVDTPEFKVPQRSAHRIRDYVGQLVRRRYSGAYGMMAWATQGREICGFNVAALAEWGWNLQGRTEKEFATAWATREGYGDPEAVGEWAELLGPVEFDVYDSEFPICYSWGLALEKVQEKQRPYLGEGMFRYYADERAFEKKKAVCDQALQIAQTAGEVDLANETRVVGSYVELARCVYRVTEQVATLDLTDLENQEAVRIALGELECAGKENVSAIRAWREHLGPEPWHQRVHDAILATEQTVEGICQFVSERYVY